MRRIVALILVTLLCAPAFAGPRDPLTDKEVDELREVAQEGSKRLKLLVTYARARMLAVEEMRSDPKFAEGRGPRVHDLLEDFTAIVNELDRNIDQYASLHQDIRKGLKEVVEANSEFQLKVRALKDAAARPENAEEAKDWRYVLEDAGDAVDANGDNARQTLDEQNQLAKDKKLVKPQKSY